MFYPRNAISNFCGADTLIHQRDYTLPCEERQKIYAPMGWRCAADEDSRGFWDLFAPAFYKWSASCVDEWLFRTKPRWQLLRTFPFCCIWRSTLPTAEARIDLQPLRGRTAFVLFSESQLLSLVIGAVMPVPYLDWA